MVFPVAGTVRSHSSATHGPPILTTRVALSASPYHIFTTLLTARVRYFSRSLLPSHPPWRIQIAPPLPHRETSVVTISRGKGSGFPGTASDSGIRYAFGAGHICILFGPSSFLGFSVFSFSYVWLSSSNTSTGLWKIGGFLLPIKFGLCRPKLSVGVARLDRAYSL